MIIFAVAFCNFQVPFPFLNFYISTLELDILTFLNRLVSNIATLALHYWTKTVDTSAHSNINTATMLNVSTFPSFKSGLMVEENSQ